MKMTVSRARAWLRKQWRMLPPVGWAMLALGVVMAAVITVSTVAANAREGKPSAAEQVLRERWKGVPASVDRGKAERAVLGGQGYMWADGCRTKLYAGGRITDLDTTSLSGKGAAVTGMRMWSCGGDPVPTAEPVNDTPAVPVPRVAEDADRAAREGYPYIWQAIQEPRVYLVVEVPAAGVFLIDRKKVDHPEGIPAEGQWVPNTPDVAAELK